MWLLIGTKDKTERVPGGKQVERRCSHCGEVAMFYERHLVSTFQLYFLDVVDYASRTVMACGACGTLYATDEVGAREPTAFEKLTGAAEQVGSTIASGATRAMDRVTEVARGALYSEPTASAPKPPSPEPEATDDPLADEDAALEARFKDLEKRARIRISED
jgi:hypothetical protein